MRIILLFYSSIPFKAPPHGYGCYVKKKDLCLLHDFFFFLIGGNIAYNVALISVATNALNQLCIYIYLLPLSLPPTPT